MKLPPLIRSPLIHPLPSRDILHVVDVFGASVVESFCIRPNIRKKFGRWEAQGLWWLGDSVTGWKLPHPGKLWFRDPARKPPSKCIKTLQITGCRISSINMIFMYRLMDTYCSFSFSVVYRYTFYLLCHYFSLLICYFWLFNYSSFPHHFNWFQGEQFQIYIYIDWSESEWSVRGLRINCSKFWGFHELDQTCSNNIASHQVCCEGLREIWIDVGVQQGRIYTKPQ